MMFHSKTYPMRRNNTTFGFHLPLQHMVLFNISDHITTNTTCAILGLTILLKHPPQT